MRNPVRWSRKPWVCEDIPNGREGTHVEVTPREVDVVLQHVRM